MSEPGWQMQQPHCQHQEAAGVRQCGQQKIVVNGLLLCPTCDRDVLKVMGLRER